MRIKQAALPTQRLGWAVVMALTLSACGGADSSGSTAADSSTSTASTQRQAQIAQVQAQAASSVATQADAVRLAHQATFGPNEKLVSDIRTQGIAAWISAQTQLSGSRYSSGGDDGIHLNVGSVGFCSTPAQASNANCWRDYYSADPLVWDFYRNATSQPDQLRQRVALALHQILVVSELEVSGTYGLRNYQNIFLDNAFGNYRDVLRKVTLSPVMGDYLSNVNNDKKAPNENYAREMLQLFSLGTCLLKPDGQLQGTKCKPTYDNATVRNYAFALTGWTYPPGGNATWGCWPTGANCRYYGGDMVEAPRLRDKAARTLLSGVSVPADATASQALELVLDSIMSHGNVAPFVARQLIQQLVRSNPSSAYVGRVASAFRNGRFSYQDGTVLRRYGTGTVGDLSATVAAILLDSEARSNASITRESGKLRSPILYMTSTLRALNGSTDGMTFGSWWGERLQQHVFRPPSVFSYYPPNFPVPGTSLVGPEFGINNANTALGRLNLLTYLLDWNGAVTSTTPTATGTFIDTSPLQDDATKADVLVDRLSRTLLGRVLDEPARSDVIHATSYWGSSTSNDWRDKRVRAAAWLLLASPDFMVQP
jgi:uncharacterized protein (DUF1800 family)